MFRFVLDWLKQPSPDRETYSNEKEAFVTQAGYSIGLGNFWRFPYLCYLHGGATFLIAYSVCMLCVGMPLYLLELSLGQYVQRNPVHIFAKLCPIFGGVGLGMLVIRILINVYYNIILSWSLFYAGASVRSFISPLPWSHCQEPQLVRDCSHKAMNMSFESAKKYFRHEILGEPISGEVSYELHWWLVMWLGLSWLLVCLCLVRSLKNTSKILYATVFYPYVVLICLFGMNIDNTNAEGKAQWKETLTYVNVTKFRDLEMWVDAGSQVIYSLGVGFGGVAAVASHNNITQNVIRDTLLMCILDVITSVLCSNVLFSLTVSLSPQVVESHNGLSPLVFILFSAMLARVNSSLWSFLFSTMIFTLGFDSLLLMTRAVTTTLTDQFCVLGRCHLRVVASTCGAFFLLGLSMCTRSGIYVFEIMNTYSAKHSLLFIAFLEVIIATRLYGHKKVLAFIRDHFRLRVPTPFSWYLSATWMIITPVCLLLLFGSTLYSEDWMPDKKDNLYFIMGQVIAFCPLVPIPVYALYVYCSKGDKNMKDLLTASPSFTREPTKYQSPPNTAVQEMNLRSLTYYIDFENYM